MPKSLLPPDFLAISPEVIFDKSMPDGPFRTWLRLRALAWGANETPELSIEQLMDLTGLSRPSLYGHLRLLQNLGRLRWRPGNTAMLYVSFPDGSNEDCRPIDDSLSKDLDLLNINSLECNSTIHQGVFSQSKNVDKSRKLDSESRQAIFSAICTVCKYNGKMTSAARGRVNKAVKSLLAVEATPDAILAFSRWWGERWPGNTGQPPTPQDIEKKWPIFTGDIDEKRKSDNRRDEYDAKADADALAILERSSRSSNA